MIFVLKLLMDNKAVFYSIWTLVIMKDYVMLSSFMEK